MQFRWNDWNLEHIAAHGVTWQEAEWVVTHEDATDAGRRKYRVRGQTEAGRYLQVIFVLDADATVFVIHARELTENEKRAFRRRRR